MDLLLFFCVLFGTFPLSLSVPVFRFRPGTIVMPDQLPSHVFAEDNSDGEFLDPRSTPEVTIDDAEKFLQELGFLNQTVFSEGVGTRLDRSDGNATEEALKKFQHRYSLPESGKLDEDTKRLIVAPRCGLGEIKKVIEKTWMKQSLKYSIRSFPSSLPQVEARQLIKQAFDEWTKHINLTMDEVALGEADIYISEEQDVHRDRLGRQCTFQDKTTVAHAFYPNIGDIHYRKTRNYRSEEFLSVSMHEFGHSLGLKHILSQSSIMYPFHVRYHTKIPADDLEILQTVYGVRQPSKNRPNLPTVVAVGKVGPRLCSLKKVDTILNDAQGQTFALAGNYYYPLLQGKDPIGIPLSSKWPRLPPNVDAGFTLRNNKTFFLRRNKLWVYADNQLEAGYPKLIKDELPGLPDNPDTVYVTRRGGLLALKRKQYWFYSPARRPQVSDRFPRSVYDFRYMPVGLDAALRHTDGRMYFFKDRLFYTMDVESLTMGPGKPMSSQWFEC